MFGAHSSRLWRVTTPQDGLYYEPYSNKQFGDFMWINDIEHPSAIKSSPVELRILSLGSILFGKLGFKSSEMERCESTVAFATFLLVFFSMSTDRTKSFRHVWCTFVEIVKVREKSLMSGTKRKNWPKMKKIAGNKSGKKGKKDKKKIFFFVQKKKRREGKTGWGNAR